LIDAIILVTNNSYMDNEFISLVQYLLIYFKEEICLTD